MTAATLPDGWRTVRLKQCTRLSSGASPRYTDDGEATVPVIGANGPIGWTDLPTFTGGIAIGRVGASGSVYRIKKPVWLSDNVLHVQPEQEHCDESYVFYALDWLNLGRLASQTAQPLLTQSALGGVLVPLPPLEEQRAIAAVLDAIDETIERTDAVIETTETLRDALLHELLTRGIPGRHTEWQNIPGLGPVPASWHVTRLGELAAIRKEQVVPEPDDERPYIALEHIVAGGPLQGHAKAADSISNKTVFVEGDTLYGKLRPNLRKIVSAPFNGVCSTDILAVHAKDKSASRYLNHLLRSDPLYRHAMRGTRGTKMPRTSWKHLSSFVFALPPVKEQREMADLLDSVDGTLEAVRSARAALETTKASTADALLTGRLRTPAAA